MIAGCVFDIQRMSVHDGPGIRTTVFLKGCPLHCPWCHNPESQSPRPELALHPQSCIGCGECVKACPQGCHATSEGEHTFDRTRCNACGLCAQVCVGALTLIGKQMDVDQVMAEVLKDTNFYDTSGGGMTLSGGEPLTQPIFAQALLRAAKALGIHTAMETSGYAGAEVVRALSPLVDLWLYDVKETDEGRHVAYTGVGRGQILGNLRQLDQAGRPIVLRCPIIPGYNDREDHFAGIAGLANALKSVEAVHVEPYNRLGEGKGQSIGKAYALGDLEAPETHRVEDWVQRIQRGTNVPVIRM